MKHKDLLHRQDCPNYITNRDPENCICEKYFEIRGLEMIKAHLEDLFERNPNPELFDWAEALEEFDENY